jgi:hypothetical protein
LAITFSPVGEIGGGDTGQFPSQKCWPEGDPNRELFEALAQRGRDAAFLATFSGRDAALLAWAFATVHHTDTALMSALAGHPLGVDLEVSLLLVLPF